MQDYPQHSAGHGRTERDDDSESPPPSNPITELAKLASEISERLDEMDALKIGSAAIFVHRLSRLAAMSPPAFTITLQMMHAPDRTLASFASLADVHCRSKQAAQHELVIALQEIEPVFPHLASVIREARDTIRKHDEASGLHDVTKAGLKRTENFSPTGHEY